ncbi:hypothetical protein MRX96_016359 [Rhipicephalus microplus]
MVPNHREEPSESSRRTMSVSPRAHISSSGSSVGLTRKPSKRRHHKKSSKSRSSKGPKRTKFSSPYAPQRRLRRHPSAISQSRFCPHRREPYSGQLPAGGLVRPAAEPPSPGAEHLIVLPSGCIASGTRHSSQHPGSATSHRWQPRATAARIVPAFAIHGPFIPPQPWLVP